MLFGRAFEQVLAALLPPRRLPKEEFRREVEKELTGTRGNHLLQVVQEPDPGNRAGAGDSSPNAGLRQITRSRGYCLVMIGADFLGGASGIQSAVS
jgi:hypothetical protein